ncbi:uncharacterized protein LY89DRAFT_681570 [Mollisia scopiformis]|uniref:Uncharacterized protein n=1 Tax=Mollisia scopiformis TaxID=149040 RepID=A0A194XL86_MOLSC|nr:uncharacterized protein LY89DRAFT_681570 [Mollisia scopiformis]KUJ20938.1 hypothetical protein LY89DRAFT_681570 [Mollisia scopiformis]
MAAQGQKFSFMRTINNAVPNFARDDPNDVDLKPAQADALLTYQLALPHPRYLGENAFLVAGLVGSESLSKKVYRALVKHKIISPYPGVEKERKGSVSSMLSFGNDRASSSIEAGSGVGGEQMTVNTAGIGKRFASQLAVISVHAQRKLVGMLFFWEEECMRWKLLDEEEKEILRAVEQEGNENRDLNVALEAVEMKKKMLPSKRAEAVANVSEGQGHTLPRYS